MNCYYISFSFPCKECKGSDDFRSELLKNLWKQLQFSVSHATQAFTCDVLPLAIFKPCKNFFQLLLPHTLLSDTESLNENKHNDGFLEKMLKELKTVNWADLDYSEIVAEQMHNIADSLTDTCYSLNIYWLTCGHDECVEMSNYNLPLYGALKRLHAWNNAFITFIYNTDSECEFTEPWFQELDISLVNLQRDGRISVDNNVIWQGSLECLQNDENQENYKCWRLSRTMCSLQLSEDNLSSSNRIKIPVHSKDLLADNIKIIRRLPKSAVPFWKIFPSQFMLYEKYLLKRVLEIQETSSLSENTETLLVASIATCDKVQQSKARTTKDWMDFISSESRTPQNDKVQSKIPAMAIETFQLVLYPVEPGIFIAYFLRPEVSMINMHSLLVFYPAIFPSAVNMNTEKDTLPQDQGERRWLQLLDAIHSSEKSPLKSQFSLAVHLDASEMLKHFTKDGKPLKKDLNSLLKQIEEKRNESPTGQKETQKRPDLTAGVEYCSDSASSTAFICSPKLLPKHETLSICNTPKTLAKARLQDIKREASKSESSSAPDGTEPDQPPLTQLEQLAEPHQPPSTQSEQLEQSRKKSRSNKRSSDEQRNKETETSKVKGDCPPPEGKSRKKRRSFDGNEKVQPLCTSTKEKRSDRHKRRLSRVVRRSLIKYGVDPAAEYFTTCSERLYYLCKSFLKDLKTSEGLNNEMKRLADSNVATVVEFEKRRQISKDGGQQSTTS